MQAVARSENTSVVARSPIFNYYPNRPCVDLCHRLQEYSFYMLIIVFASTTSRLLATSPTVDASEASVQADGSKDFSLHWRKLSITAGQTTLVHKHSGTAHAGRLLGVLGPSGAGKSSLLNALGGVLPTSTQVTGSIWQQMASHTDAAQWQHVGVGAGTVALLEQDDAFFPELTVFETLRFAAQLDGAPSPRAHDETLKLLRQVGLEGVASRRVGERRIGTGLSGISGGERRRLAVACALAGEHRSGGNGGNGDLPPRALLADEPTTGLDAFQAERVVKLLRSLAASRGCAAVATLHQPRGSIWRELDDVMLLAPGGHVIYLGPRTEVTTELGLFEARRASHCSNAAAALLRCCVAALLRCCAAALLLRAMLRAMRRTEVQAAAPLLARLRYDASNAPILA